MTICISALDLCIQIPGSKAAHESFSPGPAGEWADYLPNDPEALIHESRQRGLEIESGFYHH